MKAWPFRSTLVKTAFAVAVGTMLASALVGLILALFAGEFNGASIGALTIGLGALLIVAGILVIDVVNRKFHPETGLFGWSDVDNLHELSRRNEIDAQTREWARSLAERIAIVLPGRARTI